MHRSLFLPAAYPPLHHAFPSFHSRLHRPCTVRCGGGEFLCAGGSIIELTGFDSEEEHTPEQEEHIAEEGDLARMEEDLEEQMVLGQSIKLAWREEEVVHRVVEDSGSREDIAIDDG
jgi:hypothetical protein